MPFLLRAWLRLSIRGVASEAMRTVELASLPAAILREIFAHGVIYGMTVDDKEDRVKLRATLSAVCRQWRDIVTNTSLLWSLVYINLDHLPSRSAWELHMTRSGTQGLDITVRAEGVDFAKEKSRALGAIALLTPHIKRWKLIHVCLQDIVVVRDAVAQWKGSADVLDEIFLSSEPDCESDLAEVALDPAFVAPRCRVFALYDIPVVRGGKDLHRHFPALDELSLVSSTFEEAPGCNWAKLMPLLTNLKHLRLLNLRPEAEGDDDDDDDDDGDEDSGDEDDGPKPDPDLRSLPSLPALEELVLHSTSLPSLNKLLSAFTAPTLSKLELVAYESADDEEERLPRTKALLRRFPALRTLRLTHAAGALGLANVRFLAEDVPRLEVEKADVRAVLGMVTKRVVKSRWPIPRLRLLEVWTGEAPGFHDEGENEDEDEDDTAEGEKEKDEKKKIVDAIRKLAEACAAAQHPLESIAVHTKEGCPEEDRTWFEKNVPKFSWAPASDSSAPYWGSVTLEYGPKA